jgi:hypothetical protein
MSSNSVEQTTKSTTLTICPSTNLKADHGFMVTFSVTFMRSSSADAHVDTFARSIYDCIDPKSLLDASVVMVSNSMNLGLEKPFHDHFVTVVDDYAMPIPTTIQGDESTPIPTTIQGDESTPKLKPIREMEIESIKRLSDKMIQTIADESGLSQQQLSSDELKFRSKRLAVCLDRIKNKKFQTEKDLCIALNQAKNKFPSKRIRQRTLFFTKNIMSVMAKEFLTENPPLIDSPNNQDNQTGDVSQGGETFNYQHEPGGQNQDFGGQNQDFGGQTHGFVSQDIQNRDFGFGGQTHGFVSQDFGGQYVETPVDFQAQVPQDDGIINHQTNEFGDQNRNQDIQNQTQGFGGRDFGGQTHGFGSQTHGFGDHGFVEVLVSQEIDASSFLNNNEDEIPQ